VFTFRNLKRLLSVGDCNLHGILLKSNGKNCFQEAYMSEKKALAYINQFYAGIGGEDKADVGFMEFDGAKGPGIGMQGMWKDEMSIVATVACGDNYINNEDKFSEVAAQIDAVIERLKPDVFIAGPAFNAGRYGVACAKVSDYVRVKHGIPSVCAMYYENPAVGMFVKANYIVATPETAAGMRKVLPTLSALALKLAKGEPIGPARKEGYLPTGHRYNEYHEKTGAERVVEILLKKLGKINIGLITSGGLVPKGNPDHLKQAFSIDYGSYDITGMDSLKPGEFNSIHGGFDTTIVDQDPNRVVALDAMRTLEGEGVYSKLHDRVLSTAGVGTNVESAKNIGSRMAQELIDAGVQAAILTST
jgi:glycine reductase